MRSGVAARSVVLIGNIVGECWPHFQRWRDSQPADFPNPLDHWSRLAIGDAAARLDATFRSPSDRPFLPFQQWAMRAEGLRPSPLGILIHPHRGLVARLSWCAVVCPADRFLAAWLSPAPLRHLHGQAAWACPVDAYTPSAFDYPGCRRMSEARRAGLAGRKAASTAMLALTAHSIATRRTCRLSSCGHMRVCEGMLSRRLRWGRSQHPHWRPPRPRHPCRIQLVTLL